MRKNFGQMCLNLPTSKRRAESRTAGSGEDLQHDSPAPIAPLRHSARVSPAAAVPSKGMIVSPIHGTSSAPTFTAPVEVKFSPCDRQPKRSLSAPSVCHSCEQLKTRTVDGAFARDVKAESRPRLGLSLRCEDRNHRSKCSARDSVFSARRNCRMGPGRLQRRKTWAAGAHRSARGRFSQIRNRELPWPPPWVGFATIGQGTAVLSCG
jgi:hypothetical protein